MCSPRTGRAIAFPMCAFDTLPSVPSSLHEPSQPLSFILVNHVVSIVCNRPSVIGSNTGLTWAAPHPSPAASAHSGCRGCRWPWPWPSQRQEGGGQAHVQRGGLRLDLEAHGREARQIVFRQIRRLDEVFRLGIAGQWRQGFRMGVHNARTEKTAPVG